MTQDSRGKLLLAGDLSLGLTHYGAGSAEAFLTLRIGTSQIQFDEERMVERAYEAMLRPMDLSSLPFRARSDLFQKVEDSSQLGMLMRLRGEAPAFATMAGARDRYLRLTLGRLELQVFDQLALTPLLGLFREAAELAPEVFLQPIRMPPVRISAPDDYMEQESPAIWPSPILAVLQLGASHRQFVRPRRTG